VRSTCNWMFAPLSAGPAAEGDDGNGLRLQAHKQQALVRSMPRVRPRPPKHAPGPQARRTSTGVTTPPCTRPPVRPQSQRREWCPGSVLPDRAWPSVPPACWPGAHSAFWARDHTRPPRSAQPRGPSREPQRAAARSRDQQEKQYAGSSQHAVCTCLHHPLWPVVATPQSAPARGSRRGTSCQKPARDHPEQRSRQIPASATAGKRAESRAATLSLRDSPIRASSARPTRAASRNLRRQRGHGRPAKRGAGSDADRRVAAAPEAPRGSSTRPWAVVRRSPSRSARRPEPIITRPRAGGPRSR